MIVFSLAVIVIARFFRAGLWGLVTRLRLELASRKGGRA
jgi:hypothetical protein